LAIEKPGYRPAFFAGEESAVGGQKQIPRAIKLRF
jgi:hypothetical protein